MKFDSKREQAMVMLGMMAGFMNLFPHGAPPAAQEVIDDEILERMTSFGYAVLVGEDKNVQVDPREFALLLVKVFEAENDECDLPQRH